VIGSTDVHDVTQGRRWGCCSDSDAVEQRWAQFGKINRDDDLQEARSPPFSELADRHTLVPVDRHGPRGLRRGRRWQRLADESARLHAIGYLGYAAVRDERLCRWFGGRRGAGAARSGAAAMAQATGGGLGAYFNALITVQRANGTGVGSALTDSFGNGHGQQLRRYASRSCSPCRARRRETYWTKSLRTSVAFGASQVLHAVVVPDAPNQQTLYRNVGITPLTEARVQYLTPAPGRSVGR